MLVKGAPGSEGLCAMRLTVIASGHIDTWAGWVMHQTMGCKDAKSRTSLKAPLDRDAIGFLVQ